MHRVYLCRKPSIPPFLKGGRGDFKIGRGKPRPYEKIHEEINLNGGFMTKRRKRISLILIFIIVISAFLISACSSNNPIDPNETGNNTGIGTINHEDFECIEELMDYLINPEKFDIFVQLIPMICELAEGYDDCNCNFCSDEPGCGFFVRTENGIALDDLHLSINYMNIPFVEDRFRINFNFNYDTLYRFDFSVNGNFMTATIRTPAKVKITHAPETINPSNPTEIRWTLNRNSSMQHVGTYGYSNEFNVLISPNTRRYTFPAYTLHEVINIEVGVCNFIVENRIMLWTFTQDWINY